MKRIVLSIALCSCLFLAKPAPVSASIIVNFMGTSWTDVQKSIVDAAAAEWTSLLDISQDLTLYFKLADLSGSTLGQTSNLYYYTASLLPAMATITMDTGSLISWSLTSALAGYYDALTIVAHEIGHALGIASVFSLYSSYITVDSTTGAVYFEDYRLYSSSDRSHLYDSTDLLYPYLTAGLRLTPSDADLGILSIAYGYTIVPLPAALLLFGSGLAAIAAMRRRPRRQGLRV